MSGQMILTEDARESRGVKRILIGAVVGIIVGIFIRQPWVSAMLIGLWAGVMWRGISVTVPGPDQTMQYRILARPLWFRWVMVGVLAVLAVFAINDGRSDKRLTWFALVVMMAVAVIYALRATDTTRMRRPGEQSIEDQAVDQVNPAIFGSSGLVWRSRASGLDVYPQVIARGLDARGRAYFDAEIIRGQQTIEDFEKSAGRIASAWHVPTVMIGSPATGIVRVTAVLRESGITGEVVWQPAQLLRIEDYVQALPMGAEVATGDPWTLDLTERNFVIGGIPGSGKSSFANALLAHLARHPHVRIAFLDLKRGAEVAPWLPRVDMAIDNADGDAGTERALSFISDAVEDMSARYQRMIAAGVTNAWTEGFLGVDEPLKVLVIDECSELFKTGTSERAKLASRCIEELKTYVQQGRAAGYVLIMSTQYPKDENLPTSLREAMSDAIAFRVKTERNTHAIFGYGYLPDDLLGDPTKITAQGQAVVIGGDDDACRIQMAWLDKATKLAIIEESALNRGTWLDAQVQPVSLAKEPEQEWEQERDQDSAPEWEQDRADKYTMPIQVRDQPTRPITRGAPARPVAPGVDAAGESERTDTTGGSWTV